MKLSPLVSPSSLTPLKIDGASLTTQDRNSYCVKTSSPHPFKYSPTPHSYFYSVPISSHLPLSFIELSPVEMQELDSVEGVALWMSLAIFVLPACCDVTIIEKDRDGNLESTVVARSCDVIVS